MENGTVIPLFPLGVVIFPGMPLPLHIFEERYKQMIGECLYEKKAFGIVFFDGTRIHETGCSAEIVKVIREYPDGRSDILVKGKNRFFIKKLIKEKAYTEAGVEFFDDKMEKITIEWQEYAAKGVKLLWQLGILPHENEAEELLERLDFRGISFLIADCEDFTWDEKQAFLEMTSTFERLRKGTLSLEKLLERNRLNLEIKKIIGGNGNVKKYIKII